MDETQCLTVYRNGSALCSGYNMTVPETDVTVSVVCVANSADGTLELDGNTSRHKYMVLLFGLLVATLVVAACLSFGMWWAAYNAIDTCMRGLFDMGKAGHGKSASPCDRNDIVHPCRGLCKLVVLVAYMHCAHAALADMTFQMAPPCSRRLSLD